MTTSKTTILLPANSVVKGELKENVLYDWSPLIWVVQEFSPAYPIFKLFPSVKYPLLEKAPVTIPVEVVAVVVPSS